MNLLIRCELAEQRIRVTPTSVGQFAQKSINSIDSISVIATDGGTVCRSFIYRSSVVGLLPVTTAPL